MSFYLFLGARGKQRQSDLPKSWKKPIYTDEWMVMQIHSNCPFPVNSLPECGKPTWERPFPFSAGDVHRRLGCGDVPADLPPPFFVGQTMYNYERNRFGTLLFTQGLVAVETPEGGICWVCVEQRHEEASRMAGVVLFPLDPRAR